jgi:hypothetical protein
MNFQPRILLFLVSCSFLLIACKDQKEIRNTLQNIYEFEPALIESKDVSEELRMLLAESCISKKKVVSENQEQKKIGKKFLSSGKCGFTNYRISDINIHYNKATALVSLVNSKENMEWIDTVKLVYQKRWKVDDINYNKLNSPYKPTLKEILLRSKREIHC